jgi:hypothetical protein
MAMALDMRPAEQSRQRIKEKFGMKRTLTILSAALFAGALMVPAVQAQTPPDAGAPAAAATPSTKKHHMMRHHHHKKSTKSGAGAEATPAAPAPSGGSGQ